MQFKTSVALALLPHLIAARFIERRDATATPTSPPGPSPTKPGIAPDCDKFHQVISGDACFVIEDKYKITDKQLHAWNKGIDQYCSNLVPGEYVCVHVPGALPPPPSPTLPGTKDDCKNYYKVQGGDTCPKIEGQYGITHDQFRAWNPHVQQDCQGLWADYYVCIGV